MFSHKKILKFSIFSLQIFDCHRNSRIFLGADDKKISAVLTAIPKLKDIFDIHCKVGEGTFSSVFLATLKAPSHKRKFAIKFLTSTYPPKRLEMELKCLQEIGY